jgi:nicotinamidase-related amidase
MKNVHLLMIDVQNDFCNPKGALFVAGADADAGRLAKMIEKNAKKITAIHATLDSHRTVDVAHPIFWVNSHGEHPKPFTLISEDDVVNGVWTTTNPGWRQKGLDYVKALKKNNRYMLCIWPPHCLIGTWGHALVPAVSDALLKWDSPVKLVDFVTKGSNPFTEHYSAVQADVPDTSDPSTMINTVLLDVLAKADEILIAGEALNFCVCNTVRDVANQFGEENIKKFILLDDCCSNVGGFEKLGVDFVSEMLKRGMNISKSTDCF